APGVAPPDLAEAAPDALLPSRPERVLAGEESLLDLVAARTVMVLAAGAGEFSTGSGLSVGPGLIVTNYHVIAQALGEGGQILVTGAALAEPQPATVVKTDGPFRDTGGDFALLQIADDSLPAYTVHLPDGPLTLSNVVAAGYPGDVLETDAAFSRLREGDLSAVPGLTVTDGIVNTEQQLAPETRVLMHSAALSTGNSGGPLVDMCGRLVGVNAFIRQGEMQNRGFALTSGDLMAFLAGTAAAPATDSTPCAPVVARPDLVRN
ncbi:serine protease, partial [Pseudooceanicola lipolyticus]